MKTSEITVGKKVLASVRKILKGVDCEKLAQVLETSKDAVTQMRDGLCDLTYSQASKLCSVLRDETLFADLFSRGHWSDGDLRAQKRAIRKIQIEDELQRRRLIGPRVRNTFGFVTFGGTELEDVKASLESGLVYKNVLSIERDPEYAKQARKNAKLITAKYPKTKIKVVEGADTVVCEPESKMFSKVAPSRFNADYMGVMGQKMLRSLQTTIAQSLEMAPHGVWKYGVPFAYDFTVQSARSKTEDWDLARSLIPVELRPTIEALRQSNPKIVNHHEKVIAIWAAANHFAQSHKVLVKLDFAYYYHEMADLPSGSKLKRHPNAAMMIVGLKLLPPCGTLADYEAFRAQQIQEVAKFALTAGNFLGYKDVAGRFGLGSLEKAA